MCGVRNNDRIKIEHMKGSVKIAQVTKKITKKRITWHGHVKRRNQKHVGPTKKNARCTITQYQEKDGDEDGKPGGKTRVNEVWKVEGGCTVCY